jgi:NADH-quinone oxidoreductase subunit M
VETADNNLILSEKGFFTIKLSNSPFLQFNFWFHPISVLFLLISLVLVIICAAIHRYTYNLKRFYILLVCLELFLFIIFLTSNALLFYICFECSLIPMFIIIGIWGSKERKIRATFLFLMYSVIGSFLFLSALVYIFLKYNVVDLVDIQFLTFSIEEQSLLWLGCFFSFAIKTPLVPFHLWLPEAHVEAPTAGSVMLAGILLKLGSYGFLRFNYTLFPTASYIYSPYLFLLGLLGVLYASSAAFLQFDIKKIIAYSSVAHMGIITLGLFTMNHMGFVASVISMISHSFVASGLFLCIGIIYEKFQTRNIFYYGGLFRIMPIFSVYFFILSFANMGFPGTLSFVGEFFTLQALTKVSYISSIFIFCSFIISSVYILFLLNRLLYTNFKISNLNNNITTNFQDILQVDSKSSTNNLNFRLTSSDSFFNSLFFFTFISIILGICPTFLIIAIKQDYYSFF